MCAEFLQEMLKTVCRQADKCIQNTDTARYTADRAADVRNVTSVTQEEGQKHVCYDVCICIVCTHLGNHWCFAPRGFVRKRLIWLDLEICCYNKCWQNVYNKENVGAIECNFIENNGVGREKFYRYFVAVCI